jgi:hypothetical protein
MWRTPVLRERGHSGAGLGSILVFIFEGGPVMFLEGFEVFAGLCRTPRIYRICGAMSFEGLGKMRNFIFKPGARSDAALICSIQKYELNAGYECAFVVSNHGQRLVTAATLSSHSSQAEEKQ